MNVTSTMQCIYNPHGRPQPSNCLYSRATPSPPTQAQTPCHPHTHPPPSSPDKHPKHLFPLTPFPLSQFLPARPPSAVPLPALDLRRHRLPHRPSCRRKSLSAGTSPSSKGSDSTCRL